MNNKNIKAISFDVWNTLIPSNKEYTIVRNEIISKHLNIDYEKANELYRICKKFFDTVAEINGTCFSTSDCWKILCKIANKKEVNHEHLMNECQILFNNYIPKYDKELVEHLKELKRSGFILAITSNTNFISGNTLYKNIFDKWNVFDTASFSDQILFAKPHRNIFNTTFNNINKITELKPLNVLHVGDNKICDGLSIDYGFNFEYVKNPEDLLLKLKNNILI